MLCAGVLSVTFGGAVPAFSGSDGGASQEISVKVITPDEKETPRPAQPEKQLLSDEELQEMTEISAQSGNLGGMTGGDMYIHGEELLVILLGVLLVLLIIIIIF
jgi:hypothetical protein